MIFTNQYTDRALPSLLASFASLLWVEVGLLKSKLGSYGYFRQKSAIVVDPDILGGAYPVFRGTRVPSQNLFNYLKKGYSIEEFLLDFPTVTRDQAMAVLEFADESIKLRLAS